MTIRSIVSLLLATTACTGRAGFEQDDHECHGVDDDAFCGRLGAVCGRITDVDNCGTERTVDCGACEPVGPPPMVTDVLATNTPLPRRPPAQVELTAPAGTTLYVKWRATDPEALALGAIRLYYTTDDANYVPFAVGLDNAANGACTPDDPNTASDDGASGCFLWPDGSPTDGYFRIRVVAEDTDGQRAGSVSAPLNTPNVRLLVGDADPGTDLHGERAMFFSRPYSAAYGDHYSLVVTPAGRVYYLDRYRGLLFVDPTDNNQRILLRKTATASGDGGPVKLATAVDPVAITRDHLGRILVLDADRIRRIDTTVEPMTIDTIAGGGDSTADEVDPLELRISPPGNLDRLYLTFTVLPNGDLYFQSGSYRNTVADGFRIRILEAATNRVRSLTPSGTGTSASPTQAVTACALFRPALTFDAQTGELTDIFVDLWGDSPSTDCAATGTARLDPETGVAQGPHVAKAIWNHTVTSPHGVLYGSAKVNNRAMRYDRNAAAWETVLGTGSFGFCPDGTPALECDSAIDDLWVNRADRLYFVSLGRIRWVDDDGRVQTLMGQSASTGDGGRPLSARLHTVTDLGLWHDGQSHRLVLFDFVEKRMREAVLGVAIETVAGNGAGGVADTVALAMDEPLSTHLGNGTLYATFAVHPADGRIFFNRGGARITGLDRDTGRWSDLVGGGDTPYYNDGADGLPGSELDPDTRGYHPTVFGYGDGQILVGLHRYEDDSLTQSMLKLYRVTDGTQSHLAGVTGVMTTNNGSPCDDGTALSACRMPRPLASHIDFGGYDPYGDGWVLRFHASDTVRTLTAGGTIGTLATPPQTAAILSHRTDGFGESALYYCASGGLFAYDIGGQVETPLPLPSPVMACVGERVIYLPERGSLLFAFQQQGLGGVAEYLNTDNQAAVVDDCFDDGNLGSNRDGAGTGFVAIGAGSSEVGSAVVIGGIDADDASASVNGRDVVSFMAGMMGPGGAGEAGAKVAWIIRRARITTDQGSTWAWPASGEADWALTLGLAAAGTGPTVDHSLGASTGGGIYIQLYFEREQTDAVASVTGSVRIANGTKPAGCDAPACEGLETLATFALPRFDGQEPLVSSLRVDPTGWSVRFGHATEVTSGALSGAWATLNAAALTTEFDAGTLVTCEGRNLGAGRGSALIDRVLVRP